MSTDVFILGGARTPMTDYSGALKDVSALELGATAARAAFAKTGVKPEWIDHAVVDMIEIDHLNAGSLITVLRAAIGGSDGIEIQYVRTA